MWRPHVGDIPVSRQGYHRAATAAKHQGKLDDAISLLEKGIDNCVSNDELKTLRDAIVEQKRKPKGAAKVRSGLTVGSSVRMLGMPAM